MKLATKRQLAVGLVVTIGGGLAVEFLKGFPVLGWIGNALGRLANWLGSPVTIQRWVLISFWIMLILFVGAIVRRFRRPAGPTWLAYQTDHFLDVTWRWQYFGNSVAEGTVVPYCPKCLCQMVFVNASTYTAVPRTAVTCDECGYSRQFEGYPNDIRNRIGRLVERSINTGTWLKAHAQIDGDAA